MMAVMPPTSSNPRGLRPLTYIGLALPSAILAAVLNPSPDAVTMLLLWPPTWLACCGLLLLVRRVRQAKGSGEDDPR
jgi:hypothetical protein